MTAAVCLKCGAMKHGAFTPCPKCAFTPESAQDCAKAILLSDHNLDGPAMEQAAKSIAAGNEPSFDDEEIAQMAAQMEEFQKHPPPGGRGCMVVWWSLIALMVLLLAAVVVLYWHVKWRP